MTGPAAARGRQRRRRVVTNRSFAGLLGMHGEEAVARFAARDIVLPLCEADALRYLLFELSNDPGAALKSCSTCLPLTI